ncbi:hypothetical protein T310_9900, partial [Rasamsonia emersonii CBS 393.64]
THDGRGGDYRRRVQCSLLTQEIFTDPRMGSLGPDQQSSCRAGAILKDRRRRLRIGLYPNETLAILESNSQTCAAIGVQGDSVVYPTWISTPVAINLRNFCLCRR